MRRIVLDCSGWQTGDDFYDAFFAAVRAPSWHGRNFDALNDSICTGSINEIETPYLIVIKNIDKAASEAREIVREFKLLVDRRSAEGCQISISFEDSKPPLTDLKIHTKLKLSALWVSVMLLYLYGDVFGFFRRDIITDIAAGKTGFIGTQGGLLAAAIMMSIPSVMVFLSLVLKPSLNRWLNIILGALYTLIILATMPHTWMYYLYLGVVEAVLTLTIVLLAWRWPREQVT
jgi:RNAse (barnase) inhibitor barstar